MIASRGREAGLELSATLDIAPAVTAYAEHFRRFEEWLDAGMAATMGYLPRGRERRRNPLLVFPEAKSVFCVAVPYSAAPLGFVERETGPRFARYLRGGDYHSVIAARMEAVLQACAIPGLRWKICVDTSAVLERAWCSLAGLGWIGRNSLLIHPQYGSYLLLGVAFLNQETGDGPRPVRSLCGNCEKCLNGCPTQALVAAGKLDSRRCISYWTLEKRGELGLSDDDRKAVGTWVAGCDVCQEVCPFNSKAAKRDLNVARDSLEKTWDELLPETSESYSARVRDTALSRIKANEWRRNLELASSNRAR